MTSATPLRVYVPSDTTARSLGADGVAAAIAAEAARRNEQLTVVRNGSRGLYWLEPMVEVEIAGKRLAYGPIEAKDVPGLFEAGFLPAGRMRARSASPTRSPGSPASRA
jgi:formate dehydrogenase iron-sulfur subunit